MADATSASFHAQYGGQVALKTGSKKDGFGGHGGNYAWGSGATITEYRPVATPITPKVTTQQVTQQYVKVADQVLVDRNPSFHGDVTDQAEFPGLDGQVAAALTSAKTWGAAPRQEQIPAKRTMTVTDVGLAGHQQVHSWTPVVQKEQALEKDQRALLSQSPVVVSKQEQSPEKQQKAPLTQSPVAAPKQEQPQQDLEKQQKASLTQSPVAAQHEQIIEKHTITVLGEKLRETANSASQEDDPSATSGTVAAQIDRVRQTAKVATRKAKELAASAKTFSSETIRDPRVQVTAASTAGGSVFAGFCGGAAGLVGGTAVGTAVGVPLALFTFGLSIPVSAVIGGVVGSATGAVVGATAGGATGGAAGFTVFTYRKDIKDFARRLWVKVRSSKYALAITR